MKLTTTTQVSVDGVMQGPGSNPVAGEGGVIARHGWAHFDNEARTVMGLLVRRAHVQEAGALAALLGQAFETETWDVANRASQSLAVPAPACESSSCRVWYEGSLC